MRVELLRQRIGRYTFLHYTVSYTLNSSSSRKEVHHCQSVSSTDWTWLNRRLTIWIWKCDISNVTSSSSNKYLYELYFYLILSIVYKIKILFLIIRLKCSILIWSMQRLQKQHKCNLYPLADALNSHIRQTFPDHIDMDFADCCQFLLSLSSTHGRTGRFFRMPPIVRHRVAHQNLISFRQWNCYPVEHMKVLAVFIDRQDLKNAIVFCQIPRQL